MQGSPPHSLQISKIYPRNVKASQICPAAQLTSLLSPIVQSVPGSPFITGCLKWAPEIASGKLEIRRDVLRFPGKDITPSRK